MIVEVGGGKGGFKDYLENGIKAGRDFHRNELDQRVPLHGDLDVFEVATSLHPGEGRTYDHITLSFSERHVSDEMLQIAVNEFLDHALFAWPEEDRNRVPVYAEAHRPKLQSYVNKETGEDIERFVHIHIGIGRHDLLTGKAIEPLGYLGERTDNLKYIDAWQESFNAKHGFSSPKDNPRITPENSIDVIARYTGKKPDEFGSQNSKKAALEITLQKEIIEKNITTWEGFGKLLATHGAVSKMNDGRFGECYRIKQAEPERAMRLKGVFFQRQFIVLPTEEKLKILQEKARSSYLEQMQPRKEPGYVAGILTDWQKTKAKEFRYLNTGSTFYKNVYLPADAKSRLEIINTLERKHHGITSPTTVKNRKIAPARNRVPGMPIRNMDGIQSRTEMLLRGDSGMDVRDGFTGNEMGAELRQTDGRTSGRNGGGSEEETGIQVQRNDDRFRATGGDGVSHERHRSRLHEGRLVQPSSVLARAQADLLERYERAADKDRYAEIKKNIDCDQLLASLSHSHGLTPALYQVTTAKDGTPRIQCGSRALTASDFLTHELGLPWKEAAPILRQVYEQQIGKRVTKVRGKAEKSQLWKDFMAERLADMPALKLRQQAFDAETKSRKKSLSATLAVEKKKAIYGLFGDNKKAAKNLEERRAVTVHAEFDEERKVLRKSIIPTQADAWPMFLQARAQAGSEEALANLRKLDGTARATPAQGITGTIYLSDGEDEKKKRRRSREAAASILSIFVVSVNGDVTYSRDGHAVLRDEGQHIAVLDQNSDEAITAALLLGREKFGTNLTLSGSQEFQRRVVEVAVAQGIQVKFIDPQLETLRMQLTESKRQPMQQKPTQSPPGEAVAPALTPSNKTAQRGIDPAVAEPTQEQQMQRARAARAVVKEAKQKEIDDKAKLPETPPVVAPVEQTPIAAEENFDYDPGQSYDGDENVTEIDYLDDIHKQIAAAQAAASEQSSLRHAMTQEADYDAADSGVIVGSNEQFVALASGKVVMLYQALELTKNLTYDGTDTGPGRFAPGNELTRKNSKDGMRTLLTEEREAMQTEVRRARAQDKKLGR